jgi:soluble lytic murein transglycosylase-like protein
MAQLRSLQRFTCSLVALAAIGFAALAFGPAPSRAGDLSDLVRHLADADGDEASAVAAAPPISQDEAARIWDAFLTSIVKRAGTDADVEALRDELFSLLLGDRYEVVAALDTPTEDGARWLADHFQAAWPLIDPVLDRVATALPPEKAERYREFLTSGRLLDQARERGWLRSELGSPTTLRELARRIVPAGSADPLAWDDAVDPELRRIFGFEATLPAPVASPLLASTAPTAFLVGPLAILARAGDWLVPAAHAAGSQTSTGWDWHTLVTRLNAWVPSGKREFREYVPMLQEMLDGTAHTLAERRLPDEHFEVYRDLVIATAWQESCWRQYEKRAGQVQPLRGPGGTGLMQVNVRVWRGLYDAKGIAADIGYNGRAGSEILYQYMRKHAIRGKEHMVPGGETNLARATYAAYNGGPGHLRRYRKPETSPRLRAVDQEFFQKYQAVENSDQSAFFSCAVKD